MGKLTEPNIKAAPCGETLWDTRVTGLHLRCSATKKVFYLYYRTKSGVQRRPKLGNYGQLTLERAREIAKEMLGRVANGEDPSGGVQESRNERTLGDLWLEWRKRKGAAKKSAGEDLRLWEKKCSTLAKKRLSEITYEMVDDLHKAISKDAPVSANRVVALLKTLFRYAVAPLRWIEKSPCLGVELNRESRRSRYMTATEAVRICSILDEKERQHPAEVAFLWLLILTGARHGEIAKASWSQLSGNSIVLPEHKTDQEGENRVIILPPAAADILDRLPRNTATLTGVQTPRNLWRVIRKEAGCPDLRIHDLRHSFASAAISQGLNLDQIRELLGHRSVATTRRYAHLMGEAALTAATSTTESILERMRPTAVNVAATIQ